MFKNIKAENKILIVSFIALLIYFFMTGFGPERFFQSNNFHGIRILRDDHDRSRYFEIARQILDKEIPRDQIFSEYPQLATYFFIIPAIFAKDSQDYFWLFSLFMAFFQFLFIILFVKILKIFKKNIWLSLLFVVYSFSFFSLNRFDILPSLVCLFSFYLLFKKKFNWAFFTLACSFLIKWYAVLIFPIFIFYILYRDKKLYWKGVAIFLLCCLAVFLSGFLIFDGPVFLKAYIFHLARSDNLFSLRFLINFFFEDFLLRYDQINLALLILFLLLQFLVPLFSLVLKINSKEKLLTISCLSILFFVLFSKFYSPQWIIWYFPFLVLLSRGGFDVLKLVSFDLVTYFSFPLTFDLFFPEKINFLFVPTLFIVLFLIYFIYRMFKNLIINEAAA